jgi:hypothetical protein
LVCGLILTVSRTAHAHDPYEITSTAYLRSNRLDVEIEMEFRTALSLAGVENPWSLKDPPEDLFQSKLPLLQEAAGNFFKIAAGGEPLAVRATNVVLGVENHVRFTLEFPADARRPLRFAADGLKPFEGQGPYGTSLTVLDMVNKKVLSQAVLYPATPGTEVGPQTIATTLPTNALIRVAPARLVPTNTASAAPPEKESAWSRGVVFLLAGLAFLAVVAVWCRRKPA